MRKRWLVVALALFAAAAWLLWRTDQRGGPERLEVRTPSWREMPRRQRRAERERMLRRQTLRPRSPNDAGAEADRRPRDPLLVAMPPGAERAIVVEASAIKDSPIGRLILRCGLSSDALERIETLRNDAGLDVIDGLDRVAVADDVAFITGDLRDVRVEALLPSAARHEHEGTVIYEAEGEEDRRPVVAVWDDEMLIAGRTVEEVRQAIDRLEGRAPAAPPFDESDAYGEIYGVVDAEALERALPEDLRSRLRGTADRIELHVDTRDEHDVLIVADATGSDTGAVADLGKSLAAALAVARVTAQSEGDEELAQLLDLARVNPETGAFRVETALPLETLERRLCARGGGRRRGFGRRERR